MFTGTDTLQTGGNLFTVKEKKGEKIAEHHQILNRIGGWGGGEGVMGGVQVKV